MAEHVLVYGGRTWPGLHKRSNHKERLGRRCVPARDIVVTARLGSFQASCSAFGAKAGAVRCSANVATVLTIILIQTRWSYCTARHRHLARATHGDDIWHRALCSDTCTAYSTVNDTTLHMEKCWIPCIAHLACVTARQRVFLESRGDVVLQGVRGSLAVAADGDVLMW